MRVLVDYDAYNSLIEEAKIPIDEDKFFQIKLSDLDEEDLVKTLEIKAVNSMTDEEVVLQMSLEEVKQFNKLVLQFIRQL